MATPDAPGPPPRSERPERLGLLGGTFDPPHRGHLAAATACRDVLGLDRVLLVVANDPWQKSGRRVTPAPDRLAMVAAAADGVRGLEVSAMEIDRGGPSYTIDTVEALLTVPAGAVAPDIHLVVGADLVDTLPTWERAATLARLVTLAVVARPGAGSRPAPPPGWRAEWVEGTMVDVSSSVLRERLERGAGVEGLVPDAVIRCIDRRGLYAVSR